MLMRCQKNPAATTDKFNLPDINFREDSRRTKKKTNIDCKSCQNRQKITYFSKKGCFFVCSPSELLLKRVLENQI